MTTRLLTRRTYATVLHDPPYNLYHLPKPASARRPPPKHRTPSHPKSSTTQSHNATLLRRRRLLIGTSLLGIAAFTYLVSSSPPHKTESPITTTINPGLPVVIAETEAAKLVDSGTSSVPPFPRDMAVDGEEFTLIGLGIRTVSFLGIQVYVVGFYIHVDDLAELQMALVKRVDEGASSVTKIERDGLKKRLMDPVLGEEVWEEVLNGGARFRSVFRIVPTRNTDFQHLRDGWVRGIQSRSTKSPSYDDEAFSRAMGQFKAMFGGAFKKSVPKQKTLLLVRDKDGGFSVFYDPSGRNDGGFGGEGKMAVQKLGELKDPRVSKALWLCYLAGAKPASEPARESIVDGMLEMASRPTATLRV
ncbi:hypothetical protein K440DRAFT_538232 [Wilcoxina mikolae CBS 423.85]|nr:hypothetical protein K440DRAFT_538232 [Wilcoxina mikolae CBS 423.85]